MQNITHKTEKISTNSNVKILRYTYTFSGENAHGADSTHRLVDTIRIHELIEEITEAPQIQQFSMITTLFTEQGGNLGMQDGKHLLMNALRATFRFLFRLSKNT